MLRSSLALSTIALTAATLASSANAAFTSYVIREGGGNPPTIEPNNDYVPGATEFIIAASGQKAGWGSNDLNGAKIEDITSVSITRHDDPSRFDPGSGPAFAPYINLWITNATQTKFAVIANEPTDPAFQALYNNGWDLSYTDLASMPAKVYETDDKSWLPNNGVGLTFADIANFTIQAPSVAQLNTSWAGLGGGAPRELGTNVAYGFTWVFGDTLSHYVSGAEGYVVSNPSAVPEPASLALLALGGASMLLRGRSRG